MTDYRYSIEHDGVIRRATIQRVGDDDTWANYWDADQMIAFTVDWYYGSQHVNLVTYGNDVSDLGQRVIAAFERTGANVLDPMARFITGESDTAKFILVNLDRGQDMYAMCWNDDPGNKWRDEIEAVYNHEVYRIVVDRQLHTGVWLEDESDCTDYYGRDNADAEWEKEFPLTEYPAEMMVGSDQ